MKKLTIIISILSALASSNVFAQMLIPSQQKRPIGVDNIVAIVEDKTITNDELSRAIAPYIPSIEKASRSQREFQENIIKFKTDVLRDMIDRVLIVKEFREKGMSIPASALDSYLEDDIKRKFNGDRSAFLRHLQSQNKTIKQYRTELEENIIVSSMKQRVITNLSEVSPAKIQEFYEKNKQKWFMAESANISQITVRGESTEDAKLKADNILAEIKNGLSFEDAAKKYSTDEYARNGGKAGASYHRGQLKEALDKVIFEAPVGNINEPVLLSNYAYILRVDKRTKEGVLPIDEVREEIEREIAAEASKAESQKMIERLREKAYIRYF